MSCTKHKCPSEEESSDNKKHKAECDKTAAPCDKTAAPCDKTAAPSAAHCDKAAAAASGNGCDKEWASADMPKIKLEKNDKGYALSYAIVYVSDMTRSAKFYKDLFGFKTRFESEYWTEFDTGTTALSLHKSEKHSPSHLDASSPLPGQGGIGWFVPCSKQFHEHAVKLGARVVHEPAKQDWGGIRAVYADPDGAVISVVEAPNL